MHANLAQPSLHRPAFDPVLRGYHILYRANEQNHCPGCGRSHWIVGRTTAECAFCGTALPLDSSDSGFGGQPRFVGLGTPGYAV